MNKKYLLIIPDFIKEKVNLPPLRYFGEINKALSANNNKQVNFFSITSKNKEINFLDKAIQIKFFNKDKMFERFRIFLEVLDFSPDEVWISVSKASCIYYPFLRKIKCKTNLIIMSPIYSLGQLTDAVNNGVKLKSIRSLVIQTLVPSFLFKYFLNSNFIDNVIVISKSNKKFLKKIGVKNEKIKLLSVGVDKNDKLYAAKYIKKEQKVRKSLNREIKILYIGAPRKLRGFDLVLEGFSIARQKGLRANLKFLLEKIKLFQRRLLKKSLMILK